MVSELLVEGARTVLIFLIDKEDSLRIGTKPRMEKTNGTINHGRVDLSNDKHSRF